MQISLHTDHINERGISASVFEYSKNLNALGHQTTWFYDKQSTINNESSISKFSAEINLHPYKNFSEIRNLIEKNFDLAYFQKHGRQDIYVVEKIPCAVHVVFNVLQKHGTTFAYISDWLARHATRAKNEKLKAIRRRVPNIFSRLQSVPYCVDLPIHDSNYRRGLGIPEDAFVILTMGGSDSFNIPWVISAVRSLLDDPQVWFIGVNSRKFIEHPRAIFVPTVTDKNEKVAFLQSANCFLHARLLGESFGMALLEAMQCGIPILSWRGGLDRNHIGLLHKECLYRDQDDLLFKINGLKIERDYLLPSVESNLVRAKEFSPANVMQKFCRVFGIS